MKKIVLSAITLACVATLSACDGTYSSSSGYSSGPSQDYQWRPRHSTPAMAPAAPSVAATPAAPVNNGYTSSAGAPVAPAQPSAPVQNVYTSSPAAVAPATPATPPNAGYSSSVAPQQPAMPAAAPSAPAAPTAPAQPDASGYSSGSTSFPVNPDDQSNSTAVPTTGGYSSGQ